MTEENGNSALINNRYKDRSVHKKGTTAVILIRAVAGQDSRLEIELSNHIHSQEMINIFLELYITTLAQRPFFCRGSCLCLLLFFTSFSSLGLFGSTSCHRECWTC